MQIKTLTVQNFRNFEYETVSFCPTVNLICGENGQGKTNLIEAMWFFSACKSFRVRDDKLLIRFQEHRAAVYGEYERNGRLYRPSVKLYDDAPKEFFLNNVRLKPKELVGQFPVVLFIPDHLSLIKGSPDGRRNYLNLAMSQSRSGFLEKLMVYNQLLNQRNALLKQFQLKLDARETIEVWDRRLAKLGTEIAKERSAYIKELNPYAANCISEISEGKETGKIVYHTSCYLSSKNGEDNEDRYLAQLERSREKDVANGFTSFGIHRDDFDFLLNEKSAQQFASQGQQRSCVMALKMAESDALKKEIGEYPIMLFDDVFSELDARRKDYLLRKISDRQVILSSCETALPQSDAHKIRIREGRVLE